jgi:hypothetical protein
VKNYEETSLPEMLLYMDTHGTGLSLPDSMCLEDTLVECATAVTHYLLAHQLSTSLIFYSAQRMQIHGSRPEHFRQFYSLLSDMPFDSKFSAEEVLTNDLKLVTQCGNLFLITWSLSDKLYNLLMLMNNSSINITVILVYAPKQADEDTAESTTESGGIRRMVSELRNADITVIDLQAGDNLMERVSALT